MDYSIWSILEVNACVTFHAKVESLKASLKTAWVALSQNVVRAAVEGSERRLEAVARAKGGHIARYVVRCERRDGMCLCLSPQPNTLTDDLNTSVLLCCRTYGGPCNRCAIIDYSLCSSHGWDISARAHVQRYPPYRASVSRKRLGRLCSNLVCRLGFIN